MLITASLYLKSLSFVDDAVDDTQRDWTEVYIQGISKRWFWTYFRCKLRWQMIMFIFPLVEYSKELFHFELLKDREFAELYDKACLAVFGVNCFTNDKTFYNGISIGQKLYAVDIVTQLVRAVCIKVIEKYDN